MQVPLAAAVIALAGVMLAAFINRRGAGVDRLWQRRADTYVELIEWLYSDEEGSNPQPGQLPHPLQARLSAYGTDHVDARVAAYRTARRSFSMSEAARHQAGLLRLTVRNELAIMPSRTGRLIISCMSRGPLARLVMYLRAKRRDAREPTPAT